MYKYFLSILIFSFTFALSQNEETSVSVLEIKYEYSFVRDTADINPDHRLKEIMILDFNSNTSIFYSQQYMAARKVFEQAAVNAQTNRNVNINTGDLPKYKIGYSVYRKNADIFVSALIGRDIFTFGSTHLKWNTHYRDIKTILGYQCNMATTVFNGRMYTAWYTKDIPVSEGPYRFKGLTGLILDVSDKNRYHSFEAVSIEKKQTEIKPIQKGIPVTREQYLRKKEEFKSNPYPDRKNIPNEKRNQMINMFKKDNNSLEK